jgi:subtilisin family serine protease
MKLSLTRFPKMLMLLITISIATTWASAQVATQSYQGHEAAANEVLIKFQQAPPNDPQAQAEIAADIQQAEVAGDIDVARTVGSAGWMRFHSRSNDVTTLMSIHTGAPGVAYVEPNWILHPATTPNDPDFPYQWGLQNTGQYYCGNNGTPGADIGAVPAWSISPGSRNILVGVVDSGIDYTHPDLTANVWSAPSQFSFLQGTTEYTCPAGTHGFNVISNTCDPMETDTTNGHGTANSGIIGAVGNNDLGVAGVNWATTVVACVAWTSTVQGSTADAINCLQFMEGVKFAFCSNSGSAANIRVLNNSYVTPGFTQAFLNEIDNTYTADMLFAAAAGDYGNDNDTIPVYPASYAAPNVIAVAATDNLDNLASYSDYGAGSVALGAPGSCIYSTSLSHGYRNLTGTSEASPHVAGTAALSLSECAGDTDWLVPNILNNVVKTSALTGKTIKGGRVNAYNSLYAGSNACPGTGAGMVSGYENSRVVYQNGHYVTVYDSGTINLVVNGSTKTVSYGQYSTAYGLAILLSSQVNNDSTYPVRAHRLGSTLFTGFSDLPLAAKTTGPGTCYTLSAYSTWNTTYFPQPSFSINPSGTALVGCK